MSSKIFSEVEEISGSAGCHGGRLTKLRFSTVTEMVIVT
jgi:hypothetical protein